MGGRWKGSSALKKLGFGRTRLCGCEEGNDVRGFWVREILGARTLGGEWGCWLLFFCLVWVGGLVFFWFVGFLWYKMLSLSCWVVTQEGGLWKPHVVQVWGSGRRLVVCNVR